MKLHFPQYHKLIAGRLLVFAIAVTGNTVNAQLPGGEQTSLPLKMNVFSAKLNSNKVILNWEVSEQQNISYYIIEKNLGGGYDDAGVVFANEDGLSKYSFTDKIEVEKKGTILYRLRVVSKIGKYTYSTTRMIRMEEVQTFSVNTYPNPCVNELRISVPQMWQDYKITYELYNVKGQLVKKVQNNKASQTEVINVNSIHNGIYALKITSVAGVVSQQIIKSE